MKIDNSWYKKTAHAKKRPSAGGVICRKENGELFVALMFDMKFPGAYELPKGGVEEKESIEVAAMREIREETGLSNIKLICFLGREERLSIHKKHWSVTDYFLFSTVEKEASFFNKEKRFIIEWFPLDELPDMFWPEQKKLVENNRERIRQLI